MDLVQVGTIGIITIAAPSSADLAGFQVPVYRSLVGRVN